jgi:hypothetical protein
MRPAEQLSQATIGPSKVRATSGATLAKIFGINHFLLFFYSCYHYFILATITKIPYGAVVGFRNFAWVPN